MIPLAIFATVILSAVALLIRWAMLDTEIEKAKEIPPAPVIDSGFNADKIEADWKPIDTMPLRRWVRIRRGKFHTMAFNTGRGLVAHFDWAKDSVWDSWAEVEL